ncbi:MAG TPA: hypothetical protein VFF23_07060 [Hanamia sp.]|nr:hypothetical protein [Hanamia sp.]
MNTLSLEDALEDIKIEKETMQKNLQRLRQKESDLEIQIFIKNTGLNIGTKVSIEDKIGVITAYSYGCDVHPYISYLKRDGTPGNRESKLYSWDIKKIKIISDENI